MEYSIRPIQKKDREAVEKICIATGPVQAQTSDIMRDMLLAVFCHYYIEREPEHCFVAVNDRDEAVGYILCAHDFEKWKECFEEEYLKKQENPMTAMVGRGTIDDLAPYAGEYPRSTFRAQRDKKARQRGRYHPLRALTHRAEGAQALRSQRA